MYHLYVGNGREIVFMMKQREWPTKPELNCVDIDLRNIDFLGMNISTMRIRDPTSLIQRNTRRAPSYFAW